jgi:serine O-acetyltransferase
MHEDPAGSILDPGRWTIATLRFGAWAAELPTAPLRRAASKIYGGLRIALRVATGNMVHREMTCGANLDLRGSRNVVIHPAVVIGDRCSIASHVTLGTNGRHKEGAPTIGNDVVIETGARLLGPITVGDHAVIRANSLVITDVPAGATAMGVPARVVRATCPDPGGTGARRRPPA